MKAGTGMNEMNPKARSIGVPWLRWICDVILISISMSLDSTLEILGMLR
jgi:hypothetical protein